MATRLLSLLNIAIGIFVCYLGSRTLSANFFTQPPFSFNNIFGYIVEVIGFSLIFGGIWRISFRYRCGKILEALEKFHSHEGVEIEVFAKYINKSEEKTLKLIYELLSFGYVKRVAVDYINNKIVFLDSESVDGDAHINFIYEKCECGGSNKVTKGQKYICAYCQTEHIASGESTAITAQKLGQSKTESKSLSENLKIGCGLPILNCIALVIIMSFIFIFSSEQSFLDKIFSALFFAPLPLGCLGIGYYLFYKIFNARKLRVINARYLSTIIHLREEQGIELEELARFLKIPPENVEKNIKTLINKNYLVGVTYDEQTKKIKYLDNLNFDRFVPVICENCYGESVATYGKANKCPYCDNNLELPKKFDEKEKTSFF